MNTNITLEDLTAIENNYLSIEEWYLRMSENLPQLFPLSRNYLIRYDKTYQYLDIAINNLSIPDYQSYRMITKSVKEINAINGSQQEEYKWKILDAIKEIESKIKEEIIETIRSKCNLYMIRMDEETQTELIRDIMQKTEIEQRQEIGSVIDELQTDKIKEIIKVIEGIKIERLPELLDIIRIKKPEEIRMAIKDLRAEETYQITGAIREIVEGEDKEIYYRYLEDSRSLGFQFQDRFREMRYDILIHNRFTESMNDLLLYAYCSSLLLSERVHTKAANFWDGIYPVIQRILCDDSLPKEWVKDLIHGDTRNLIIGLVSALTSQYSIELGIAIPIVGIIMKKGVINFCQLPQIAKWDL